MATPAWPHRFFWQQGLPDRPSLCTAHLAHLVLQKASSLRAQLVALKQEIDTADKAAFLAAFEADQDGLGTALEGTAEQPAQPAVGAGPAEEQQQKSAQAEEPAQEQAPVQGQEQQLEAGVARQASPKQNLSREERRKQADAWRQSKRQNQPEPTQPSYPQQEVVMQRPPQLLAPPEGPPPGIGEEALAAEGSGYEILLQVGGLRNNSSCSLVPAWSLSLSASSTSSVLPGSAALPTGVRSALGLGFPGHLRAPFACCCLQTLVHFQSC